MKSLTHIILVIGLAFFFSMVVISIFSEESEGNIDIYDSYTDHNEKHLLWNEYLGSNFDHYKVYRDDAHIGTVYDKGNPQYHDTGITGGNYTYRVEACNADGDWQEQSQDYKVDTQFGGGLMLYNVVLSPDDGPYNLTVMVEQKPGVELTIEQNTRITGGAVINISANQKTVKDITLQGGLRFHKSDGVSIYNCVFDLDGGRSFPPGLHFMECKDIEIYLNDFSEYDPGAWPFSSSPILFGTHDLDDYHSENATIHHNTFHDNYYCIGAWDLSNSSIHNNTFEDNYGSIFMIDECYNNNILDNTFTRNWGYAINIRDGYFPEDQSSGHWIMNNEFDENDNDLYVEADNVILENNTARNGNSGMVVVGNDCLIRFNDVSSKDNTTGTGLGCAGERSIVSWNKVVNYRWGIYIGDNAHAGNITVEINVIRDCGDYGIYLSDYDYISNCIVRNNSVTRSGGDLGAFPHWEQGGGIYLARARDTLIENNTLTDNDGEGICVHYYSDRAIIQYNTITNNHNNGIRLWPEYKSLDGIRIHHNNITGNDYNGIYFRGRDDINNGYSHIDNTTIEHNEINGNGIHSLGLDSAGLWIELSNNITVKNNRIHHLGKYGVYIKGSEEYPCYHVKVDDNNISRDYDRDGFGILDEAYWWQITGGEFTNNTFGWLWPTCASVAGHNDTLGIGGVDDLPDMPKPPAHDPAQTHIGKFLEIGYDSDRDNLWLQIMYEDNDVQEFSENDMIVWMYNFTSWEKDEKNKTWKKSVEHNTILNHFIVEVNTTGYSGQCIIAPLGPLPAGQTINVTIDSVTGDIEPDATITVKGNITSVPQGTVQVVKLYLDSTFVKNADTFSNTDYTTTLDLPVDLSEGNHVIMVEAILTSGKSDTAEETIAYHAPPEYTVTVTIAEPGEVIAPDAAITIAGDITVQPASPVQSVKYFLDGTYIKDATTFSNVDYSGAITLPGDLATGDYKVMVEVLTDSGVKGYANRTLSYYKGPGDYIITITINTIDDPIEPSKTITVAGTIKVEPDAVVKSVKFYLDGEYISDAETFTSTEYSGTLGLPALLAEGDHVIMVRAILVSDESDTENVTINYTAESNGDDDDDDDTSSSIGGATIMVSILLLVLLVIILIILGTRSDDDEERKKVENGNVDTIDDGSNSTDGSDGTDKKDITE